MSHQRPSMEELQSYSDRDLTLYVVVRVLDLEVTSLEKLDRIKEMLMAQQDDVNTVVAALNQVATDLPAEFQALKDQIANGVPAQQLDLSGLESVTTALQGVDTSNVVAPKPTDPNAPTA